VNAEIKSDFGISGKIKSEIERQGQEPHISQKMANVGLLTLMFRDTFLKK
jgi:hypothetical protein